VIIRERGTQRLGQDTGREPAEDRQELDEHQPHRALELRHLERLRARFETVARDARGLDPHLAEHRVPLGGGVEHAVADRDERDVAERDLRASPDGIERTLECTEQRPGADVVAEPGSPCVHASGVVVLVPHGQLCPAPERVRVDDPRA
jgi:hypothetical protein